jgi:hypothetical protein
MKKKIVGLWLAAWVVSFAAQAIEINAETLKGGTLKLPSVERTSSAEKKIRFEKSSETKELLLNLDSVAGKRCLFFLVKVQCGVIYGKMTVEVIAPDNKVMDKYSLEASCSSGLTKVYRFPKIGIWKVRMVTDNATANVQYSTETTYIAR